MKKKAFTAFFTDHTGNSASQQLVEFVNKHELSSTDYHLITTFGINSGGFVSGTNITCVYHAEKSLA